MSEPTQLQWLLLTQNIGGIECTTEELTSDNKALTSKWMQTMKQHVLDEEERHGTPVDIIVLHLQEVGGKKFNRAFITHLGNVINQCTPYSGSWCSGLLMPDEDDGITFTAIATVFFVAPRVAEVCSLLSFRHRVFISVLDGPLQWVKSRRALFHGAKFSGAGTSRKGFLLTTLRVGCQVYNFVNVHLFHDAENSVAAQTTPSEYAVKRVEAVVECMNEIQPVIHKDDPLFIFGDFNFRLDIHRIVKAMQQQFGEPIKLGKKKVEAPEAMWQYLQDPANWDELRTFDTEGPAALRSLREKTGMALSEPQRGFGPTYLVETDPTLVEKNASSSGEDRIVFHRDRFPGWCDRVWLSASAAGMIDRATYWTVRLQAMDHIPVQLRFSTHL